MYCHHVFFLATQLALALICDVSSVILTAILLSTPSNFILLAGKFILHSINHYIAHLHSQNTFPLRQLVLQPSFSKLFSCNTLFIRVQWLFFWLLPCLFLSTCTSFLPKATSLAASTAIHFSECWWELASLCICLLELSLSVTLTFCFWSSLF